MKKRFSFQYPLSGVLIVVLLIGCAQNTPDAVFNRGLRAMEEGDIIGASLYFGEFIEKFPGDERVLRAYDLLANCHYLLKDFASARSVFQEVRDKHPSSRIATRCDFEIGRTYFEEGNYIQAATHFTEIASATTDPFIRSEAHVWLGHTYARQTKAESAIKEYETMYQISDEEIDNPTDSLYRKIDALSFQAVVYRASEEFEKTRSVYLRTLDMVKNATSIAGLENERQNAVLNWAHTWVLAQDYISSATIYDSLHNNPFIMDVMKPELIVWKVRSLENLFRQDGETEYTPEELAVLVHENERLVKGYSKTDQGINARIEIARLIKDSTPEASNKYFDEAIEMLQKYIAEPPTPERPMYAMIQIAQAYLRMERLSEARQTIEKLQQSYSNVPRAMREARNMLYYIQQQEQKKKQEQSAQSEATPK